MVIPSLTHFNTTIPDTNIKVGRFSKAKNENDLLSFVYSDHLQKSQPKLDGGWTNPFVKILKKSNRIISRSRSEKKIKLKNKNKKKRKPKPPPSNPPKSIPNHNKTKNSRGRYVLDPPHLRARAGPQLSRSLTWTCHLRPLGHGQHLRPFPWLRWAAPRSLKKNGGPDRGPKSCVCKHYP